jgi:phage-related baseplate assembly protein
MDGGELLTPDIINAIYDACSPTDNRPLSDLVQVLQPSGRAYLCSVEFWIPEFQAPAQVVIDQNVNAAVNTRLQTWKEQLGGVIDPSALAADMIAAGGIGVVVNEPVWTVLEPWEQPVLTDDPIIVNNGLR